MIIDNRTNLGNHPNLLDEPERRWKNHT